MKLYLIYAIIPSNVFSTRIKYLIDNVKDFKTQGNNRVGLYAWTTSKKILEEFLEGRDHDIYKVIKKEFMDDEDIDKFKSVYNTLELHLYHYNNKHSETSGKGIDIVTTKSEYVNSVLDLEANITGFGYPTFALFDYSDFNQELKTALEILNYNYYYDSNALAFDEKSESTKSSEEFNEVAGLLYLYGYMFGGKEPENEIISDIH